MIKQSNTLERLTTQPVTPARSSSRKRFAMVLTGAALAAAVGVGAVMVIGGGDSPTTVGPVVTGDRDAAWISSLERQAAAANQPTNDASSSELRAVAEGQPPVTDKEEGLRQAEERRAALNR